MKTQKINHYAVWASILAFQAIPILWYSPLLFAGKWLDYLGKTIEDFDGESMGGMVFSFTGAITFNYFLAWLFKQIHIDNAKKGFVMALTIALCCFVLQTFTQDSFSLRPFGLSLINCGCILMAFCVSGIIIGSWKKFEPIK
jgi:hypothetical protein